MTEEDMIRLRDNKESAIDALKGNITEEQRERLSKLIPAIDEDLRQPYSKILHVDL